MAREGAARRYAEALFELATAAGKVDEWRSQLGLACELAADRELARLLDSPAVGFADRRTVVEKLLAKRASDQVRNLVLLLVERNRFSLVTAVSDDYDELVRRSRGIVAVHVTSAAPLAKDELAAVTKRVEELAGSKVEITTDTDPSLIGGLRVTIGDRQIDASVVTRLARLRRQLVQGTI